MIIVGNVGTGRGDKFGVSEVLACVGGVLLCEFRIPADVCLGGAENGDVVVVDVVADRMPGGGVFRLEAVYVLEGNAESVGRRRVGG